MTNQPEIFVHIELLLGSIGVIIGLFFGLFLVFTKLTNSKANLFLGIYLIAYSFRIGKSLFNNYFEINEILRTIFLGLLLLVGPSLYLYSKSILNPKLRRTKQELFFQYCPYLLVLIFCFWIPNDRSKGAHVFFFSLVFHGLIYSSYTLFCIFKEGENGTFTILDTQKKWLLLLSSFTVLMFLNYLLVHYRIVPYYMSHAILYSVIVVCLLVFVIRHLHILKTDTDKYAASLLNTDLSKQYMLKLMELMNTKHLYLDTELNLKKLSIAVGISAKQLSQVINQEDGLNYSAFITRYRIAEIKKRLISKKFENYTIAAIAYDCGFNSISSFNTAFKKIEGCTAVQYRQKHTKG